MGSWLFGGGSKVNNPTPPATALRIQTSIQGRPIPWGWGTNRLAGNLIWYGDFSSLAAAAQAAAGGKGGSGSGGGKGSSGGSQQEQYFASVAIALGAGPISDVLTVWNGNSHTTLSPSGLSFLNGSYAQSPWGYLSSAHPDQADAYRGLALAVGNLDLGNSAQLPNFSFEVQWARPVEDDDPRNVVLDVLTDAHQGIGWPTARLGTLNVYSAYAHATGMLVSPVVTEQKAANSFLKDLIEATNSEFRWSSGVLDIVPYGDQPITANGATYTPNVAPIYDIVDFQPNQGSAGSGSGTQGAPIICVVNDQSQMENWIKVSYNDRNNDYNPAVLDAKDQASIDVFKARWSEPKSYDFFTGPGAAQQSAQLLLGRAQIPRTMTFTVGAEYILIDVMDVITLTRAQQGFSRLPVRVKEITENADATLTMTAEEFLGTAAAPLYGHQASAGYVPNYNADPGDVNQPIIFEPTDELGAAMVSGGGLIIAGAISGQNPALWGGCEVWAAFDPAGPYTSVGTVHGAARMGVLQAVLPAFTVNPTGQTIDQTSTLAVDLTESQGALPSATDADAIALNTRCYVGPADGGGEIVSFGTSTLTAQYHYSLNYLVRGGYGTEDQIAAWPTGTPFARLDQGIFEFAYDKSRIGATVYLKFTSFNLWGGGIQNLSDVEPFTYNITGSALASPLPTITNLTSKFVDGRLNGSWDEIDDFRSGVRYEIRRGAAFDGAQILGTVAHPPFAFPGDGTYWVTGWVQPAPGLIVRSEQPVSIDVVGATLNSNVVATYDCQANGWAGTFVNAGVDTGLNAVRIAGAGNALGEPNILPDIDVLNLGGEVSGTYRPAFIVDIGRVAPCQITITMVGTGVPVGSNLLGSPLVLPMPDVLGSVSAQYVDVFPNLLIAQDTAGSILPDADTLGTADVLSYALPFAAPVKYSPGVYVGRIFAFEFDLDTIDPNTIALLLSAVITVDVPDRVDSRALISGVVTSLTNVTVPAGGLPLVFLPDGASTAAAFNGGPGGGLGSLPQIIVTWGDEQAGDVLAITNETTAGVTIQILNSGVGVQRNKVNIFPRGY